MCWVNTEITLHSKNYRRKLSIESHGRKSQRRVNSSPLLWAVTLLDVTKPLLTRCRKSKPFAYPRTIYLLAWLWQSQTSRPNTEKNDGCFEKNNGCFGGDWLNIRRVKMFKMLLNPSSGTVTGDNFIHSRGKNWLKKLSFLLLSQYVTFIKGAVLIHGIPS